MSLQKQSHRDNRTDPVRTGIRTETLTRLWSPDIQGHFGGVVIYLFAVAVFSGSFLALFALWLLVWTFTMSDDAPAEALASDELSLRPALEKQAVT